MRGHTDTVRGLASDGLGGRFVSAGDRTVNMHEAKFCNLVWTCGLPESVVCATAVAMSGEFRGRVRNATMITYIMYVLYKWHKVA